MPVRIQYDRLWFNIIGYTLIGFFALLCILPFVMVITGSFTPQELILQEGYRLVPSAFTLEAYQILFGSADKLLRAYGVSIVVTVVGTSIGLFLTAMTAYVLNCQDFKYRNHFSFYFYFTTLFSGGLVPWYIMIVKYLDLKNNLLALIVPLLLNVFYILIMRSFVSAIPEAIKESAKIDGAGDFTIFFRLILPLLQSALATIGLFIALNYWNDWFNSMLFMDNEKLYSLQYFLYQILSKLEFMSAAIAQAGISTPTMPTDAYKMAMTLVATGPTILLYPFVQRYFVKGITIGAVKG
ncbi:carbohydrate ABC transporter permease [Paenibacillus sedimenti]|uniref:Carbohydrate ABC transporter permease n=1 Tax=Paenibacillus sedimenti TaxID=2770274 RepID=A0A926KLI6_9BACL|nr:carbohydrate ABC transporter permease [Paenibacillus sedimenti]MBD0378996.1 carbohydrate ABC transporter permease [Paenibacillus sedimenti]